MRIKDLDESSVSYERAKDTDTTQQKAIQNYKAYVKQSISKENHSVALKRLADLELTSSEISNEADSEAKAAEAKTLMLSSIENYNTYLRTYPDQKNNDLILYQLSKAYSFSGNLKSALKTMDTLVRDFPKTQHIDEVQFRRGEILFSTSDYKKAEIAFAAVINRTADSIFHEKASYKLGWSQFKQSKYLKSLSTYLRILDRKQKQGKISSQDPAKYLNRGEKEFIHDTLRAINLSLSYQGGAKSIPQFFSDRSKRIYQPLIYKSLAEFYLKKGRHADAANVFLAYGELHPNKLLAAEFTSLAILAYADGNLHDLVLSTKKSFVTKYGVGTDFWKIKSPGEKEIVKTHLVLHIKGLTSHWHALAQQSKQANDFETAVFWYNTYLTSFPDDKTTPAMNFLLADLLFDAGKYNAALKEYVKTGYQYPAHDKNSEAAYAAILTYNKLIELSLPELRTNIKTRAINNSILFSNTYPDNEHTPKVVTKTAEDLFDAKKYKQAAEFARRITYKKNITDKQLIYTAWTVYAHSLFELQDYIGAEHTYDEVLKLTNKSTEKYKAISEKLAACIYKQGEAKRNKGYFELAAYHFMRLGKAVPSSSIRPTAEYDAAAMQIQLEHWDKATKILEDFKLHFPNHQQYSAGIAEKLALTYTKSDKFAPAAAQLVILTGFATNVDDRKKLTWQSAEMYGKAGDHQTANEIYIKYIAQYPKPFSQLIEAHKLVSDYYLSNKQHRNWRLWLRKTVNVESAAGNDRTDRSNLIAAQALMHLTKPLVAQFKKSGLHIPLNTSLKKKKRLMQLALASYAKAMQYQIAEITTESTFYVAEIYHHFAEALMQSQRPQNLNEEELEQYDILLEEQAYPFEEKTIEIHASNVKRIKDGIYDNWVKSSLSVLEELQPIRYFKKEKIEHYVSTTH